MLGAEGGRGRGVAGAQVPAELGWVPRAEPRSLREAFGSQEGTRQTLCPLDAQAKEEEQQAQGPQETMLL